MSTSKTNPKSHDEMSPEEREKEHARRLHEEVDAVLKRGPNGEESVKADDHKPEQ